MEPTEQLIPPTPPPTFINRRSWLIVFGIVELLIAAAFLGLGFMMVLIPQEALKQAQAQQPPGAPQVPMLAIAAIYATFATVWVVVGIGTILTKNWARVGSLVLSYFWLICGLLGTLVFALVLPMTLKTQPNLQKGSMVFVEVFMFVFMGIIMVLVPGVFLIFFHNKNVKATCLDAEGGVESKRPVVMNVLIVLFAISIFFTPFSLFSSYPALMFGTLIWGLSKILVMLAYVTAEGIALWGYLKTDIRGWWVSVVATVFWTLSSVVTLMRGNLGSLYERMGISPQQLKVFNGPFLVVFMALGLLFVLAKLGAIIYSRRYFPVASSQLRSEPVI